MGLRKRTDLRNIAIIAHVDHGKTTLVDAMLKQAKVFRENQQVDERIMDSNALERERGITILAKNTAITIPDSETGGLVRINIVDTPGHADFGGEVERVMNMVDGAILLVDAAEGPMAQTRFVLKKALHRGLKVIVVINKMNRKDADPERTLNRTFDLFIDLGASDEQADFPVIYANGIEGRAGTTPALSDSLQPLFDTILRKIDPPEVDVDGPFQMMVTNIFYDEYRGLSALGKINRGRAVAGMSLARIDFSGVAVPERIRYLMTYNGLSRVDIESADAGEIIAIMGLEAVAIGETLTDPNTPEALPIIRVEEPTVKMTFAINSSPMGGREGKFSTSRNLRERLYNELRNNVALRVEDTDTSDAFVVAGRGELHLAILIETMRREGYELQVGQPQVIIKEIDGVKCEPIEQLTVNLPEEYSSRVIDLITRRRGEMTSMESKGDRIMLEFTIPSRGIIGLNNSVLTASAGEAVMAHRFIEFAPWRGDIQRRLNGSIIAMESGTAFAYALNNLQSRGRFFIAPQDEVYAGQVIGEHTKDNDLVVNVCKSKKLTNMRASGSDDKVALAPPVVFSLEDALEYIKADEYVEVTPNSMRMRKIILDELERKRRSRSED